MVPQPPAALDRVTQAKARLDDPGDARSTTRFRSAFVCRSPARPEQWLTDGGELRDLLIARTEPILNT
jgi:hypothetical protein